jgi:hypothetical protein
MRITAHAKVESVSKGASMRRPTGVTILAVLSFAVAVALLGRAGIDAGVSFLSRPGLWIIIIMTQIADWGSHALWVLAFVLTQNLNILVGVYFLMALLHAAIGVGFLRMQNWARLLMIVLAILQLATTPPGYASPRFLLFRQGPLTIAIHIAVLIYLFRPKVKQVFAPSAG